jgi:hypothetical protein
MAKETLFLHQGTWTIICYVRSRICNWWLAIDTNFVLSSCDTQTYADGYRHDGHASKRRCNYLAVTKVDHL